VGYFSSAFIFGVNSMKLSTTILGKNGAMGRAVQSVVQKDPDIYIVDFSEKTDFIIDFSSPEFLISQLPLICQRKIPLVSGTTGLSSAQFEILQNAAEEIPVFYSENFSLGITFLQSMISEAVHLPSLISSKIHEIHHTRKKDQPSGTALRFQKKMNQQGIKPSISSQRIGEVVGTHTITFDLLGESLELTHRAHSKEIYAKGAIEAGKFLLKRPLGFYCMDDLYSSLEV